MPKTLAEIAVLTAEFARRFDISPRVAMLSFSNFGSNQHPAARKVQGCGRPAATRAIPSWRSTARCRPTPRWSTRSSRLLPLEQARGGGQRPDLPRPGLGQHRLQADLAPGRRRGGRSGAARHGQARARAAARRRGRPTSSTWPPSASSTPRTPRRPAAAAPETGFRSAAGHREGPRCVSSPPAVDRRADSGTAVAPFGPRWRFPR